MDDRKSFVKYHKPFVQEKDLTNDIEWYKNTENFEKHNTIIIIITYSILQLIDESADHRCYDYNQK